MKTQEISSPKVIIFGLFGIRNRIFPAGSTPEGGPTEIIPTTQATRHPWASSHSPFPLPPFFCHASCIRSVPSPVLPSCTYTLSSLWSVPTLFSRPTHIFKPHSFVSLRLSGRDPAQFQSSWVFYQCRLIRSWWLLGHNILAKIPTSKTSAVSTSLPRSESKEITMTHRGVYC